MTYSGQNFAVKEPRPICDVIAKFVEQTVAQPLVNNVIRGILVESMVALEIEPEWTWCGGDYGSWDFENAGGVRLEVKQSAARQSWELGPHSKKSPPRFDIRARKQSEGTGGEGRAAHLYIFAYHPVEDETADHRDPNQWEYYCMPASNLPSQDSIGLKPIRNMAEPIRIGALLQAINATAQLLATNCSLGTRRQF
jgi:hypothetical protein